MLIWADDFKSYGTVARLLDGLYAQAQGLLTEDPDPNAEGAVYYSGNGNTLRFALPAGAIATGGCAARYWFSPLPDAGIDEMMAFSDVSNTIQVAIAIDTTGNLYAYRGPSRTGTLLGSTTAPAVVANAWNHIEVKILISDTVGTVEVRVNGVVKLNLTALDTKNSANTSYAQLRFGTDDSNTVPFYLKDFVTWDTTGSVNNDFMGTVSVLRCTETSDVSFNWTASTGTTGYDLIDEASPNDADYISASDAPPAASVFGLEDLPEDVTSVKGVITVGRMRKTDGGDCFVQMAMKSAASTDLGADRPITSAFTYYFDVSELDPATAAPWTPVGFNAANIQVNRTL